MTIWVQAFLIMMIFVYWASDLIYNRNNRAKSKSEFFENRQAFKTTCLVREKLCFVYYQSHRAV